MRPKDYRRELYELLESKLDRNLLVNEHDKIRDLLIGHAQASGGFFLWLRRELCLHRWKADKDVMFESDMGQAYYRCIWCDQVRKIRWRQGCGP